MPRLYPSPVPAKESPPKAPPVPQGTPQAGLAGKKSPLSKPSNEAPQLPLNGWQFVRIVHVHGREESGLPPIRCSYPKGNLKTCNRRLLHVHLLSHPDREEYLKVGCCCAVRLGTDYDPVEEERRSIRLLKFLNSPKWKMNRKGNLVLHKTIPQGVLIVTIVPKDNNLWSVCLAGHGEAERLWVNGLGSEEAAKKYAFRRIEELKAAC